MRWMRFGKDSSSPPGYFPGGLLAPDIPGGKMLFVNGATGSDNYDGLSPARALKTVSAAEAKCTAGKHDTVYVIPSDTAISETKAISWTKHHTHLVGLGPVRQVANRCRIVCGAADTPSNPMSPFFTISARGCLFRNLMFWQGQDDATTLVNVNLSGERNKFEHVHFAGGGHATQAIDGGASLLISGGSENEFERCTFGVDTIAAGTGLAALVYAATGGAARNIFRECNFTLHAGHVGAIFVEVLGNSGIDRYQVFDDCTFENLAPITMTQAIAVATGFDPDNKRLLLRRPALIGAGEWESNNRGAVYVDVGALTGGGNSGIMLVTNTT